MALTTRGGWAKRFCNARELAATKHRLNAIVAWETAEGTTAKYNPLATTWDMPHDTLYNSIGVRNYPNLQTGIKATWLTLEKGSPSYGYGLIIVRLKENATARDILEAVAASAWGTGWLALQVLPYVQENYERYAKKLIGQ